MAQQLVNIPLPILLPYTHGKTIPLNMEQFPMAATLYIF